MFKTNHFLLLLSVLIMGCGKPADRETLTQIGTIDALLGGIYDGEFIYGN
jgi:hypothetical protein